MESSFSTGTQKLQSSGFQIEHQRLTLLLLAFNRILPTNGNVNHCKKCSARTDKHPRHIHVKHITLHWNFWWGCAARISKSRPNFRPKNAISHTRATHTQTWPQKSIPVSRDERGGHSGKSLQLTGSPPVRR